MWEKDGLWAVLLWLNILAATGKPVADILSDHWRAYGRNYYSRHDYEAVDGQAANDLIDSLRGRLDTLKGSQAGGLTISAADEFSYDDPVDGSRSTGQGIRILFEGGGRAVFRLSGTGTEGATIRVYLEQLETDPSALHKPTQDALSIIIRAADEIAGLSSRTGRTSPDVVT